MIKTSLSWLFTCHSERSLRSEESLVFGGRGFSPGVRLQNKHASAPEETLSLSRGRARLLAVPKEPGKVRALAPVGSNDPPDRIHGATLRLRSVLAFLLVAALGVLPLVAQQQQADRVKAIGSKFLCMCGCNQILTQCNHVGCTMSAGMLKDLGKWVDRGDSEDTITQAFVQQYGTTVYAEPPRTGFSLLAWAMPVVYFLIGLALVVLVITKWRKPAIPAEVTSGLSGTKSPGVSQDALERARAQAARETED